jgi:tetratricopeptide (TPR) repeat protein
LLRRVLAIDEKAHGSDHPTTATTRSDLGYLMHQTGRYREAEVDLRRALEIREQILGSDHAHTAQSRHQLAMLLVDLEQLEEARNHYLEALRVFESALGREHPNVAACLANMATVERNQGRYEESEALLRRALTIAHSIVGRSHPLSMGIISNIGRTLLEAGKTDEAAEYIESSYEWSKAQFGVTHKSTRVFTILLAELRRAQGDLNASEELLLEFADDEEWANSAGRVATARMLLTLARIAAQRGDAPRVTRFALRIGDLLANADLGGHTCGREARRLMASVETSSAAIDAALVEDL